MRQPSRFSEVGFESMKMGVFCCLDAQNGLTFTGTARRRFSPLSAGSSVLDALWIVAIILEQPPSAPVARHIERVESGFRELSATTPIRSPKSVPDTVSRSREFQVHIHPRARA